MKESQAAVLVHEVIHECILFPTWLSQDLLQGVLSLSRNDLIRGCDCFIPHNHSLLLHVLPFVLEEVEEGHQTHLCCEEYSP